MAWKGTCCSRCYVAKSDKSRCKCRCKGAHHGAALRHIILEKDGKTVRPRCGHCGEELIFDKEKGWVHQDGEIYKKRADGKDDHCVLPQFRDVEDFQFQGKLRGLSKR